MEQADTSRPNILRYQVLVVRETDEKGRRFYVAMHPELNGCIAQGATPEEARASLEEARELFLSVMEASGLTPPPPQAIDFAHPGLRLTPVSLSSEPKELAVLA